jgi:uncharacterized protein (TIGR00251 family)
VTDWLTATPDGVRILLTASPRASRTELAGIAGARLRVRVAAPPVGGEANAELVRFIARSLGLPRAAVVVTAGHASRRKAVLARGIAADAARRLLAG